MNNRQILQQKKTIAASIPKDTATISKLWLQARKNYDKSKDCIFDVSNKKRYNTLQRNIRNKILKYALDDYGPKSKNQTDAKKPVATYYEEFWDFLHFWLMSVNIDNNEWNDMENYYHKYK